MPSERIWICAVLSLAGHYAAMRALAQLPAQSIPPRVEHVQIELVAPLPEPPPVPRPAPPPPPPMPASLPPPVKRAAAPRTASPPTPAPVSELRPPSDQPSLPAEGTMKFSVAMQSTSQAGRGTGPSVGGGAGSHDGPQADPGSEAGRSDVRPVDAVEVTRMPLPKGSCEGKYTDDARGAAIEGTVVLDLIVDATGRARQITVVQPLSHGLTEAAVRALTGCRFTPGERSGAAVAVRVRGFKIRFLLQDNR